MRRDDGYTLARRGDVLEIDGAPLDLSGIPEGATLPAGAVDCPWIAGPIRREGGVLHLELILPHGPGAPGDRLFPAPLTVTADGPVALPGTEAAQ